MRPLLREKFLLLRNIKRKRLLSQRPRKKLQRQTQKNNPQSQNQKKSLRRPMPNKMRLFKLQLK